MGFFTGISNKFISGYADAFFVYCSVPVCFYTVALDHMEAGKASILCSCEPVAAMAFGFFFFRESSYSAFNCRTNYCIDRTCYACAFG